VRASARWEAVIVHIDSPGGSPTDAERIGAALDRCKRMPAPKESDGSTTSASCCEASHRCD